MEHVVSVPLAGPSCWTDEQAVIAKRNDHVTGVRGINAQTAIINLIEVPETPMPRPCRDATSEYDC
jgi:hypothetical protein